MAVVGAFQQQARIVAAAIHQDQGELVAAQPRDGVDGTQMPAQRGDEVNQRGVADRMAVAVIDGLEAIQVDHRAAGRHRHRAVASQPIAGAPESTTVQVRSEIVLVKHVLRLFQRLLQTRDAPHDGRVPMSPLGIGMHEGLCGLLKRASA